MMTSKEQRRLVDTRPTNKTVIVRPRENCQVSPQGAETCRVADGRVSDLNNCTLYIVDCGVSFRVTGGERVTGAECRVCVLGQC